MDMPAQIQLKAVNMVEMDGATCQRPRCSPTDAPVAHGPSTGGGGGGGGLILGGRRPRRRLLPCWLLPCWQACWAVPEANAKPQI